MLSKHALEEYKEIHRQETGTVLPDDVLADEAINLLTLFSFVYRPIKKAWLKEYEQQHNAPRRLATAGEEKSTTSARIPQGTDRGTSKAD
jgi:hypothetical protein